MSKKDEAEFKEKKPQNIFQVRLRGNEKAANTVTPVYKKTLWPLLFMDEVQLPQGFSASTRRQFTFYR